MRALTGNNVHLRALEPEDLEFLYEIENDSTFWEVSSTETPYSKYILQQYLANAHLDIYEAKQLRLVIAINKSDEPIGLIDLFDFNPQHKRAGIGILLLENEQQKGYASEALELLIDYSFKNLNLHQLFANITKDNKKSTKLFKKYHFKEVGIKKEWIFMEGEFKDEVLYQLVNS
ncbi:GNAT family N-acetyltransferase [Aureibaculum sp. A20]|uniref:GNAT family N-acetyltransferase n=1 Tax=Aureibaculum flavum TaxID=2795986 RepID=A0ABS0WTK4_9FLAO|nr:GNAT family N-acetyltransferase [Aureibaculum flavum]MBJ2175322.1 GNAT family N-acetyltransferase [Aureibaculum flavum]